MELEIKSAGSSFLRPHGREGSWNGQGPDDHVSCPFPFAEMAGQNAIAALDQLRSERPAETPMLLGSPHEAGILFESFELQDDPPDTLIKKAANFDIVKWLDEREAENKKVASEYGETWPPSGEWPAEHRPMNASTVPYEILSPGKPKQTVIIALLPTDDVTTTAAYLKFGDWNACPSPEVHMAIARHWASSNGAVQISNTYEIIEFHIARPIETRDVAMRRAREQYLYCNDIVDQGTDTLEALASSLMGSAYWYFWWD